MNGRPDDQQIEDWSKDLSTFWKPPSWNAKFTGQLANVYESTLSLERREVQDVIRSRFLYLLFYDFVSKRYPGERLRRCAIPQVTEIITEMVL